MTTIPSLGYHRLRIGRRSIPGQLYLVTTVTSQRRPYFLDQELARFTAQQLSSTDMWAPDRCLCWVLMPDHLHALVELNENSDLSLTMQRVKGRTARQAGIGLQRHGKLWAKGFHDHALRREEAVVDVIRYIIANPVRAGLVKQIADYPYWGVNMGEGDTRDLVADLDFNK